MSVQQSLTMDDMDMFTHTVAAPALYKWSEAAYFSESEYLADDWKTRYWGEKNYNKLLETKLTWDPRKVFGCRHCVGDEETDVGVDMMI